jgi:hypothetical protein
MANIDVSDIQGFALKGYNFPYARYLLLELAEPHAARDWLVKLFKVITTGERWDINNKPLSTVNIAFTYKGLVKLDLPLASLLSFPLEFQQGMQARADILGDSGKNAVDHWDPVWRHNRVHAWLAINARTAAALEQCSDDMLRLVEETQGAHLLEKQDACAISIDGKFTLANTLDIRTALATPISKAPRETVCPDKAS